MLYTFFEYSFNGFNIFNLDLFDIVAILSGILVIIAKNPILSVLFLIVLFGSISGHLILSGLNFIGLSYLLVYIGAVSILFLFILMLINVRISELLTDSINSIPLTILICTLLIYLIDDAFPFTVWHNLLFGIKNHQVYAATSSSWDGNIAESSHITSIGNILYGNYSMWLILTTIILLLAMVGCIVITLKDKTSNIRVKTKNVLNTFKYLHLESLTFIYKNQNKISFCFGLIVSVISVCMNIYYSEPIHCADTISANWQELYDQLKDGKERLLQRRAAEGIPSKNVNLNDLGISFRNYDFNINSNIHNYPGLRALYVHSPHLFERRGWTNVNTITDALPRIACIRNP